MYLLLTNHHVYKKRFVGFIVSQPYEFTLLDNSEQESLDAFIFVAKEFRQYISIGQSVQIQVSGATEKNIYPIEGRIVDIIDPERLEDKVGEEEQIANIVIASLPKRIIDRNGNVFAVQPGMSLAMELYTEDVILLEIFSQPLIRLKNSI